MTSRGMLYVALVPLLAVVASGAHSERVLLQDISALTLRSGQYTNGRRSAPVPQLKCVGGTAGCNAFVPQVVQCQNRGFDGYDVQWECKTDMDNAYRFGEVTVSCEGYEQSNDPYVLRGSCGLEYTIDYTKEGYQQAHQQQHQYYGDDYHDRSNSYYSSNYKRSGSGFGSLLFLGGAAFIVYIIYKTCLSSATPPSAAGPNPDDPPPYSRYDNQAPPPGFKPEFTSHSGAGCSGGFSGGFANTGGYPNTGGYQNTGGYTNTGYANTGTGTGGGFWSGMATGGILGYLFGNNQGYNNRYGHSYTRHRPYGSTWGNTGSSWGNSGWFGGGSSAPRSSGGSFFGGGSSSSSGTRTASGFGGTKRR